jgi:hypothetical protein
MTIDESGDLQRLFPGAVPEADLVAEARRRGTLGTHGVACLTICREPGCRSIEQLIRQDFSRVFDYRALGGVPVVGHAAMQEAWAASDGAEMAYFAFTHLALGKPSSREDARIDPCFGIASLLRDVGDDRMNDRFDPDDVEYACLRRSFVGCEGAATTRWNAGSLTKAMAHAAGLVARRKLEASRPAGAAFSVVSGVHVVCGDRAYVWLSP